MPRPRDASEPRKRAIRSHVLTKFGFIVFSQLLLPLL